MSRKGESITLSLYPEQKVALEKMSLAFGRTWGQKPNISSLLKAIADGELKIYWADDVPAPEIKAHTARAAIGKIMQGFDELKDSF
jgi:hypothetical protein